MYEIKPGDLESLARLSNGHAARRAIQEASGREESRYFDEEADSSGSRKPAQYPSELIDQYG
jgi:hypothetical protein